MAEFLSKENVKEIFCEFCNEAGETFICVGTYDCGFLKRIDDEPAADVTEVKHGEWIDGITGCVCSACNKQEPTNRFTYCPNCGAKMKG